MAQNFLGIQPTLNTISIYATLPSIDDTEIGSKKWHRDLDTFLAADFMFAITNINDENGPFFYIKPDDFGSHRYFNPKEHFGWESGGRFSTEELIEYGFNKYLGVQLQWEEKGVNEIGFDIKENSEYKGILVNCSPEFFRPTEVDLLLGDPTKAEKELGWERQYSFYDLIDEMFEYQLEKE